ncbi:MAG TPA: hypothetical protein VF944_10885 [Candidatus Bathyarchaeia archaeon]
MIPISTFKKLVDRFEKAVRVRECALAAGRLDHATTFEYRQAKRELIAMGQLLITGENPDRAMEPASSSKKSSPSQRILTGTESLGEPVTRGR